MRRFTAMTALITLFAAGPAAAAPKYTAIEKLPGAGPITLQVGDNARVYFRVTAAKPLEVPVDGPAHVRIVSRVECPRSGVVSYRLTAREGGRVVDQIETESSASSEARLQDGDAPIGKSRRLTFDLPAGHHVLSLALSEAQVAYLRIQTAGARGAEPMVSLTPVEAERSVNVTEGEKLIPYYTVTAEKPVRLRVIGPTTLELSSRLDFDATMRGTQSYRLRLTDGGQVLRTLEFKTTKAIAASYENVRDRMPSKLQVTKVAVSQGSHEIAVALISPVRGVAQVHARIPEPNVGNEE